MLGAPYREGSSLVYRPVGSLLSWLSLHLLLYWSFSASSWALSFFPCQASPFSQPQSPQEKEAVLFQGPVFDFLPKSNSSWTRLIQYILNHWHDYRFLLLSFPSGFLTQRILEGYWAWWHVCNPNARETGAGESGIQGRPQWVGS